MTEPTLDNPAETPTPPATTRRKRPLALGGTLAMLAVVATAAALQPADPTAGVVEANNGLQHASASKRDDLSEAEEASPPLRERVESAEARLLRDFPIDERAMSVGKPNAGRLIDAVHLPASPAYIRRTPRTMWGSGRTIASLQLAIASFRRDVGYDGKLILSDISIKGGGPLRPHASHQAGRDVDIWLPTLEGVFKPEHLGGRGQKPRPPMFDEIDWHATWGLVRALLETDAVERVFLERRDQEFVVRAALEMGSRQEDLDMWFQWPRSPTSAMGIVRHSADHRSHLHVRFKCADWEPDCGSSVSALAALR